MFLFAAGVDFRFVVRKGQIAPAAMDLALKLSVDPKAGPDKADVTFSFTAIDVKRRG